MFTETKELKAVYTKPSFWSLGGLKHFWPASFSNPELTSIFKYSVYTRQNKVKWDIRETLTIKTNKNNNIIIKFSSRMNPSIVFLVFFRV